jgi:hypothetical protein
MNQSGDHPRLGLRPVEEAPDGDDKYGPCLLEGYSDTVIGVDWAIGYKKDKRWYSYATGRELKPKRFRYLGD